MTSGSQNSWPSVFLDQSLRLCLRVAGDSPVLLSNSSKLAIDDWSHVAVTYEATHRTFALIVNGIIPTAESTYILPESAQNQNVQLTGFASQSGNYGFQGQMDELRLWKHALHPETIKSKMSVRATGLEPLLHSCWHLDEGTGGQAFDATVNGNTINLIPEAPSTILPNCVWDKSTAPLTSNIGLSKRTLRLDEKEVTLSGGIGAGVYFEQVSVTQKTSSEKEDKKDTKPLKRGARILLTFVAEKANTGMCLASLDFGLLSDGTLCDSPAIIPLPLLPQSTENSIHPQLLFVDAQGVEIFGGLLHSGSTRCTPDPPRVWDSATGSVTVYFRDAMGKFGALTYDISRSIEFTKLSGLTDHVELSASNRLRQTVTVELETSPWKYAPEGTALQLTITAKMVDNSKIVETWQGEYSAFYCIYCFVLCQVL